MYGIIKHDWVDQRIRNEEDFEWNGEKISKNYSQNKR